MKKELEYGELNYAPNVGVPIPPKNAGLYTGEVLFDKKPWGNNYKQPSVFPDAVDFTAQFYASHHIPSFNRPGNNTVVTSMFKKYTDKDSVANSEDNYNIFCHTNNKALG